MITLGVLLRKRMDFILFVSTLISVIILTTSTPLDDYVHRADPHYNYTLLWSVKHDNWTTHTINMTSQKWKTESWTDRPIWWHLMTINVPHKIRFENHAFLYIGQGRNNEKTLNGDIGSNLIELLAPNMGMITAYLGMIPNQPIVFKNDPHKRRRTEDAIAGWTWKTFMENMSDPEVLIRLPMTKAAVRAMDTVSSFVADEKQIKIKNFIVSGASKRGWTTWTTAAVDKRVVAIIPIVMDLLNIHENLHHHFRSLGGWTFAYKEYYELNITKNLDSPAFQKILDVVDPFSYKSRLTMPKLIVSSAGDEFFLTDDAQYFFRDLPGENFLRIQPNAEHSCVGHVFDLLFNIQTFCTSIAKKWKFPQISWSINKTETGGTIMVKTDQKPVEIKSYSATTLDNKRRDFRLFIKASNSSDKIFHPVIWFPDEVEDLGNGVYQARFKKPDDGRWLGAFVQLFFKGPDGNIFETTTEAMIIPDIFPVQDCHGNSCHGVLV